MSATVPVWVPLVVAGAGLVSTFGAAILTRWADGRERREQWQREDSFRWQQDRQHAYARMMAVLNEWDRELFSVLRSLQADARLNTRTEVDVDEMTRLDSAAREASALVQLMAPEAVSALTEPALKDRRALRHSMSPWIVGPRPDKPADFNPVAQLWGRLDGSASRLREAMREDRGIKSQANPPGGRLPSDPASGERPGHTG
jgi:hypothetical protein